MEEQGLFLGFGLESGLNNTFTACVLTSLLTHKLINLLIISEFVSYIERTDKVTY
jgi:hypothetical protein